jgi:hydrogenase maturation factor
MKMETVVTNVTPAMAKKWIESGGNNRNVKPHLVSKYASEMAKGKWKLHHQGIAIDEKGHLVDGQHRLLAIMQADVNVKMAVTVGVPADSFDVMDDGSSRGVRDLLSIAMPGQKFPTELASIARAMLCGFDSNGGRVNKRDIMQFAIECKDHIMPYIQIQKKMRSGLASAFANADYMAGVPRSILESIRDDLLSTNFKGPKDPVSHLYRRCTDNAGARVDAVNLRYRLGVSAIRAVIEGRQLSSLFEAQRDWESNEYKKMARKKAA